MAHRRPAPPDVAEEESTEPASVHLRRADGLDLELSGPASFVAATLERALVALGIVAPPAS